MTECPITKKLLKNQIIQQNKLKSMGINDPYISVWEVFVVTLCNRAFPCFQAKTNNNGVCNTILTRPVRHSHSIRHSTQGDIMYRKLLLHLKQSM